MRVALACLVAAVAAAGLAVAFAGRHDEPDDPRLPAGLRIGIVANALDNGTMRGRQMDRVRATGVRWLREEFRWSSVEPLPGERHWDELDHLMTDAAHRGLRVLPLLLSSPRWQADAPNALPRDAAAYGRFAGAVVNRYGPGGVFWHRHPALDGRLAPRWFELWNEPYLESGSAGGVDPAAYAAMVVAAGAQVHRHNRLARVLMAGETTYKDAAGTVHPWLDALFAAQPGLASSFDALAVHPYTPLPPTTAIGPETQRFSRIATLATDVARLGGTAKPLWITEVGWSTCRLRPDCVSERDQARDVAALLNVLATTYAATVQAVFLYRLDDTRTPQPADAQRSFGIERHDGSRKPAFAVLRRATTGR